VRGKDIPLQIYSFTKEINSEVSIDYERVCIPGIAGPAYLQGDFVNDDQFVCAETLVPKLVTIRIDGSYDHEQSALHLDTVVPGMEPIDVRYTRDSDIGWGNSFFFVGDWSDSRNTLPQDDPHPGHPIEIVPPIIPEHPIAYPESGLPTQPPPIPTQPIPIVYYADAGYDAARLLADRVFLHDPEIMGVITGGISYVGVDYVSWPAYTADLMIDLHMNDDWWSWFADEGVTNDDNYFASTVDMADFDRACRAVVVSQALRDRVRTAFDPTRLIELRERAWTETTVDQQVINLL